MEYKKIIYTHPEKKTFLEILKKYSKIVETKNNHSSALKAKNLAWQKITSEFNASPLADVQRTPKQLRRLWMNLKQRQKEIAGQHQPRLSTEGNSSNDAIDANVMHVTEAITTGVDSSMDSDTLIENIETDPIESEPGIACLYLSEESQNIPAIDKQSYSTIKIESVSPAHVTYPVETLTPIDSSQIPVQLSPSIEKNESFSAQHQENPHKKQENKSREVQGIEIHKWEIQILKEKFKSHQQESMKKEARAKAIHELEHQLLKERVREAKAKADLAELLLRRQQYSED